MKNLEINSIKEVRVKEELDKLVPFLEKLNKEEIERLKLIEDGLYAIKPEFYDEVAYNYQCVWPTMRTLLEIGKNIEKREKESI